MDGNYRPITLVTVQKFHQDIAKCYTVSDIYTIYIDSMKYY